MKIAFVGAGRLGQTLAAAFFEAGWAVTGVASRSAGSSDLLAKAAGAGCTVYRHPQEAVDAADLVFLTVPDDAIQSLASGLRWRQGQSVVHCSGATEVSVLAQAQEQGAQIGGFHPLQLFADPVLALPRVAGSSVAIEACEALLPTLTQLAESVGYRPITLPPGVRGRYHAATNYSASFLLSLLREACDLWNAFGVDDKTALAALLPLAHGTLDAAEARGLAGALSGPISRGDAGVVRRHVTDLAATSADAVEFYRTMARRQILLAKENGRLSPDDIARVEASLG
ncbi:Rossmann-like and DUF2520 domain-containing protein [Pantoea sp. 18069]|uniref:Rossmann-like and DUF2520 domain-containing protein n=1 Tax=Pantoea sp. 18069 TaxID=2681415 RepID=UPI001359C0DD|nr:DUF2520 domain-containing protein [Pantoea sp. 18069]